MYFMEKFIFSKKKSTISKIKKKAYFKIEDIRNNVTAQTSKVFFNHKTINMWF